MTGKSLAPLGELREEVRGVAQDTKVTPNNKHNIVNRELDCRGEMGTGVTKTFYFFSAIRSNTNSVISTLGIAGSK